MIRISINQPVPEEWEESLILAILKAKEVMSDKEIEFSTLGTLNRFKYSPNQSGSLKKK
jgi:hypothetical protein